jgi:uncharacterized protein YukE
MVVRAEEWELVGGNPAPGNPEDFFELSSDFQETVENAEDAYGRLTRMRDQVDDSVWKGEAAEAFKDRVGKLPKDLRKLFLSYSAASEAMATYATTLRELQTRAHAAVQEAVRARDEAAAAEQMDLAAPPTTGDDALVAARERLRAARTQADQIGEERRAAEARALAGLEHAGDVGIHNRSWLQKATGAIGSFVGGVAEGTGEIVEFAVKFSPNRALLDPKGYVEDATGLARGLAYGATHPVAFAKAVSNWDMWLEDPARALGQLVPGVALALATGGGGAVAKGAGAVAKGARALRGAAKSTDELAELQRLSRLAAKRLLVPARKAQKEVTPLLRGIAREEGAKLVGLKHKLKKMDSLTDKITRESAFPQPHTRPLDELVSLKADEIKDVLRYTVQSDMKRYSVNYEAVTSKLEARGFTLENVKNTWAEPGSPQAGPYRGINTQWRTPDGQSFELQFHTRDSFAMKERTHDVYEEARAIDTPMERQQELRQIMTRMSDEIPVPDGAIW